MRLMKYVIPPILLLAPSLASAAIKQSYQGSTKVTPSEKEEQATDTLEAELLTNNKLLNAVHGKCIAVIHAVQEDITRKAKKGSAGPRQNNARPEPVILVTKNNMVFVVDSAAETLTAYRNATIGPDGKIEMLGTESGVYAKDLHGTDSIKSRARKAIAVMNTAIEQEATGKTSRENRFP